MPHPTPEQLAAAAEWFKRWRLDDTRGHPASLAELLAEREQLLRAERDIARASADVNRKLADSYLAELRLLRRGEDPEQLVRPHPEQPSLTYCRVHDWPTGHGLCRCAPCPHCEPSDPARQEPPPARPAAEDPSGC